MIDKKIFIIGTGRNGTTWVSRWLRQHPEIFGGPETHLFSVLENFINPEWNQGLKTWLTHDKLIECVRKFCLDCFENCKFRQNKKHVVEHSYIHYKHISFIREVFPDALFIHVYRDGRNVVESHIRTFGEEKYLEYIEQWKQTIKDMLGSVKPYVLNIKYETLIEDPQSHKRITDFLCVDHHKDLDIWEFPVNTPNFEYDYNRWNRLAPSITRHFDSDDFVLLLKKLKYA